MVVLVVWMVQFPVIPINIHMYKFFDEINKVIGGFHSSLSVSILRCPLEVIIIMTDGNVGHKYITVCWVL